MYISSQRAPKYLHMGLRPESRAGAQAQKRSAPATGAWPMVGQPREISTHITPIYRTVASVIQNEDDVTPRRTIVWTSWKRHSTKSTMKHWPIWPPRANASDRAIIFHQFGCRHFLFPTVFYLNTNSTIKSQFKSIGRYLRQVCQVLFYPQRTRRL